jgi:hypothetical protein
MRDSLCPLRGLRPHCPSGQAYDETNTWLYRGMRYCKACQKRRKEERRRKARERRSPAISGNVLQAELPRV